MSFIHYLTLQVCMSADVVYCNMTVSLMGSKTLHDFMDCTAAILTA